MDISLSLSLSLPLCNECKNVFKTHGNLLKEKKGRERDFTLLNARALLLWAALLFSSQRFWWEVGRVPRCQGCWVTGWQSSPTGSHPPPHSGCERVTGCRPLMFIGKVPRLEEARGGAVRVVGGELHLVSLSDLLART
uniref:Uncharacterized protein n=1 Tax=Myotis myotis TaxID=51298 RepID=A0A7J7ZZ77_MYOMY|nr:hypothetical protein mMyoMyo1_010006 [Myotis myotis]